MEKWKADILKVVNLEKGNNVKRVNLIQTETELKAPVRHRTVSLLMLQSNFLYKEKQDK